MHGSFDPPQPPRRRSAWGVARRVVLVGGGATVGLALGWLSWPRGSPPPRLRAGETQLDSWLKIGADGIVTVAMPQAEMGQGAHSGLAQILADELGADWRTVRVEPAPLAPAFANVGLIDEMTGGLPPLVADVARWVGHRLSERLDLQLTGGSTSVRAYDAPLRLAGAAARALLCKAAARGWEADWERCDTQGGFVTLGANRVVFAEIAARAADETPPRRPALRPIAGVGRSAVRLDIPAKVDGSAKFAADVRLPGMVYAAVRHGPVGAVAPPLDVPPPPRGAFGVVGGPGWVAVAAPTWWGASKALETLDPQFPAPARRADSATIDAALDAAIADSPPLEGPGRLVEARYAVPFAAHAALEPMTATARVEGGRAELWLPTQSARLAAFAVARALGIEEAAVTIHPTLIGGGFGRKAENDAAIQAALIACAIERPVQLIWSREEDMTASPMRPAARAHLMARVSADGTVSTWRARIACPSVAQSFGARNLTDLPASTGPDAQAIEGSRPAYALGDFAAEHLNVPTPVPLGYWRSVGHSYTAFFTECFADECARAVGADPLEWRLARLASTPRHAAVLRAAAEAAGYEPGMGVAIHESFGSIVAHVVELAAGPKLRIARVTAAIDCGRAINPDSVRAQIEGSVVWSLAAAIGAAQRFEGGAAVARGFDSYPLPTLADTPPIDIVLLTNAGRAPGGVGEPGVPPFAPALANAIAASGRPRPRALPIAA